MKWWETGVAKTIREIDQCQTPRGVRLSVKGRQWKSECPRKGAIFSLLKLVPVVRRLLELCETPLSCTTLWGSSWTGCSTPQPTIMSWQLVPAVPRWTSYVYHLSLRISDISLRHYACARVLRMMYGSDLIKGADMYIPALMLACQAHIVDVPAAILESFPLWNNTSVWMGFPLGGKTNLINVSRPLLLWGAGCLCSGGLGGRCLCHLSLPTLALTEAPQGRKAPEGLTYGSHLWKHNNISVGHWPAEVTDKLTG